MTQPIEFIGMIHHRHASEIHPPGPLLLDRGYIRDFAQAAEAASFDRVLVGYFSDGPDGFLLGRARPQRIPSGWASWSRIGRASSHQRWPRANSPRWIRSPAAAPQSM